MRRIRVLVVDDSALARQIIQAGLSQDPGIEVVGTAQDPYAARDKIADLLPDVVTLDVEMPRMDGVEFLRRLMPQYPIPVVMLSSLTLKGQQITLDALEAGAVDFVSKPSQDLGRKLASVMLELRTKIKIASTANVSAWKGKRETPSRLGQACKPGEAAAKIIAIGASTGGTEALRRVLSCFPANMPGMVVVQHMPSGFTKLFADRLNQDCALEVKEAATGDRIRAGRVLIAPGGVHLKVQRTGEGYQVICAGQDKVSGHCPSVDVLMHSVAEQAGSDSVGVMLTGMGHDGSDGMLAMRKQGARTVAQDEATSVVFGMPKAAFAKGGAECLRPLDQIAPLVAEYLGGRP